MTRFRVDEEVWDTDWGMRGTITTICDEYDEADGQTYIVAFANGVIDYGWDRALRPWDPSRAHDWLEEWAVRWRAERRD